MIGDIRAWLGDMVSGDIKTQNLALKDTLLALSEAQFEELKKRFQDLQKTTEQQALIIDALTEKVRDLTPVKTVPIYSERERTILFHLFPSVNGLELKDIQKSTGISEYHGDAVLALLFEKGLVTSTLDYERFAKNYRKLWKLTTRGKSECLRMEQEVPTPPPEAP